MPRQRSPERDKAFEIFMQHNGEIENRRIAEQLNVDERIVAVWKSRDGWLKKKNVVQQSNDVQQTKKRRTTNPGVKKSTNNTSKKLPTENVGEPPIEDEAKTNSQHPKARPGNKNAKGNKGGPGAPIRNKRAVRTHEYINIFFTADVIDDDERAILDADYDKYVQQLILIDTLKIREKRIMLEIRRLKNIIGGMVFESVTKTKAKTTTSYTNRNKDGHVWDGSTITVDDGNSSHEAIPVRQAIGEEEDRLTRVQGRLQRAIEVWHKMEQDDEYLAMNREKLKLQKQRIMGQYDLDAMIDDDDLGLELDE